MNLKTYLGALCVTLFLGSPLLAQQVSNWIETKSPCRDPGK
ncbi:hypothetical protein [uncultured Shimia sp.]|nr:hypothetical protein [uncultured Shimia sp.]